MKKKISLTNLAKKELSKGEKSLITAGVGNCVCWCWCGCIGGGFRSAAWRITSNGLRGFDHDSYLGMECK